MLYVTLSVIDKYVIQKEVIFLLWNHYSIFITRKNKPLFHKQKKDMIKCQNWTRLVTILFLSNIVILLVLW